MLKDLDLLSMEVYRMDLWTLHESTHVTDSCNDDGTQTRNMVQYYVVYGIVIVQVITTQQLYKKYVEFY